MKAWYALFTKPQREYQVSEILAEKDIETYLPLIRVRRRGRTVERPFFPRYLFAHVNLKEVGLSQIRWTPGLTDIVHFAETPVRVPPEIIEHLKERLDEINSDDVVTSFKKGDKVRIVSGPLRDFEAVFDAHLSSADRVRVLVDMLGKLTRVEISVDVLEAAR